MPRKKAIRVAATRSRLSSRPAEMVAPEREMPGTSATHWTNPMMRASRIVIAASPRV